MAAFIKANDLAILTVGRVPTWTAQASYTGAPDAENDGVSLVSADSKGTPAADVLVRMRENVAKRQARVTVTFDAASTYTVTINAVAAAGATGANLAALIADLITKIGALAGTPVIVIADPLDPLDTLLITGSTDADYSIDISVAGGAGTITCVADPTEGSLVVWSVPLAAKGTSAPGALVVNAQGAWTKIPGSGFTLDFGGYSDRFATAARRRLYVQLLDLDGTGDGATVTYVASVYVGPSVLE